jgi:hypothetical protein
MDNSLWLVIVVTSAIFGIAGYVYAKKTGRNPTLWLLLGVILNVLVVAFLSLRGTNRSIKKS